MSTTKAAAGTLPAQMTPDADPRTVADMLAEAARTLRTQEDGACWTRTARALEGAGWDVHWRLAWIAEGRHEGHIEEATGATLDEAFGRLQELTLLDEVEGCP